MARRDREINIFNIAFLDVITGAMGAFVLLVVILAPYYTGSDPRSRKTQQDAQSSVDKAQKNVQQAQQTVPQDNQRAQQALKQAQDDLARAKQQLDAITQQTDQLASQNKRLSALDDQQQQQLKQAQQQIADLQKQAEQSTQQALDRAEQNMQQADQAMQTDDVEKLKRLLAQARADLQAARQQLDALSQELAEARKDLEKAREEAAALRERLQQAMAEVEDLKKQLADAQQERARAMAEAQQMQQQRDQAIAWGQQMRQELAAAQQRVQQALNERDQAEQAAQARKQTLDQSALPAVRWVLIDVVATPACNTVGFRPSYRPVPSSVPRMPGFSSTNDLLEYVTRGIQRSFFIPFGEPNKFSTSQPFRREFVVGLPLPDLRLMVGFSPNSSAPPGCEAGARFSMSTYAKDGVQIRTWSIGSRPFASMHPTLFSTVPPADNVTPTADDIALWNKLGGNP